MLTESEMEKGGGGGRGEELCSIRSLETVVRKGGEEEKPHHLTYCKAMPQCGSTSELTNGGAEENVEEDVLQSQCDQSFAALLPKAHKRYGFNMQAV